jgi:HEXXH motif-containing protein
MMTDLIDRIEDVLMNPESSPWLPTLTANLVEVGWQNLYRDVGLSSAEYGTARMIANDRSARRRIVSILPMALGVENPDLVLNLEILDDDFALRFEKRGVRFYTAQEILKIKGSDQLMDAVNIIKCVPTLFTTLSALIRSVHLIDAHDDDYDVSFSEPDIVFTIFVSVPRHRSPISKLRVAEALVHEAMHLQLTLIERVVRLVESDAGRYYSPWRSEYRTARGVLHALYVFRVVDSFMKELEIHRHELTEKSLDYVRQRQQQIAMEIHKIEPFRYCPELTQIGAAFVHHLL